MKPTLCVFLGSCLPTRSLSPFGTVLWSINHNVELSNLDTKITTDISREFIGMRDLVILWYLIRSSVVRRETSIHTLCEEQLKTQRHLDLRTETGWMGANHANWFCYCEASSRLDQFNLIWHPMKGEMKIAMRFLSVFCYLFKAVLSSWWLFVVESFTL